MNQRGDTIIEVIFAVTVFSMVAIGGLSLMNQGTAMAQRSLEISQARDQMDAQADALRYLHTAYLMNFGKADAGTTVLWQHVTKDHVVTAAQTLADDGSRDNGEKCKLPEAAPEGPGSDGLPFVLDIRKNKLDAEAGNPVITSTQEVVDDIATFAQVRYPEDGSIKPEGIWIQAVHGNGSSHGAPGYYDFHIRACWLSPGQQAPVTLGTIVRLYDPAV